jgi:hypothetical protein
VRKQHNSPISRIAASPKDAGCRCPSCTFDDCWIVERRNVW